jgi:polysaccharide chain length determinant protein (PEP-CTERM system associated)
LRAEIRGDIDMRAALEFILEELHGAWRFRWTAMLVAWIVCLIGWLVVLALPDAYSAWARVHIDTRTRLTRITGDFAVAPNVAEEAQEIHEALLAGPQLEKLATLAIPGYPTATPAQQHRIIDGLRKRLLVESNGGGPRNQIADLYTITYIDRDRRTAQRVVDQLLHLFVSSSLSGAQDDADEAQKLLLREVADYRKTLEADETRLADFKRANAGLLPGATGDYFSRLQMDKDQLQKQRRDLHMAEQKLDTLRRHLPGQAAPPRSANPNGGDGTDTATEIRAAKARLADLRRHFTDKHPDVMDAQQELEDLIKRQQEENAARWAQDSTRNAEPGLGVIPVFQVQLTQAEAEVAAATSQVEDQEAAIAELQKMINRAPQVEAEYAHLNRDHDETSKRYHQLVDRLNGAKLSEEAQAIGSVRFKVVEPPTASAAPVSPDRPRLIVMVLLGGLAAGLGAAYFLNQLRPIFTSARQLAESTQLAVLGVVGTIWMERHKAQELRAMWAYGAVTAALVLIAVIMLLTQSATSQLIHGLMA